jgi:hypothetical protein
VPPIAFDPPEPIADDETDEPPAPVAVEDEPPAVRATPAVKPPVERPPPTVEPPVEDSPPVAAAAGGVVNIEGDAKTVYLIDGGGVKYRPGEKMPPGTYQIKAYFPGTPDPVMAGKVGINDGDVLTVKCALAMMRCAKK